MTEQAAEFAPTKATRRMTMRKREALEGYICLIPWALGFVLWVAGPMFASLGLSLFDYDIVHSPTFVGLDNFRRALFEDKLFWPSLGRTFYYAGVRVPLGMILSFLAASLLNQKLKATNIYRTLYFLPSLTPVVASALLWVWILQPDVGVVNHLLSLIGIQGPAWLGAKEWAIPAMILIGLWSTVGGNRMMIFLAGLQGVPEELYEAAECDGANAWHKFWAVTLPMISPTLFLLLILGIIAALKVFAVAFVATNGGPAYATWFYSLHIYKHAFEYYNMGYSCTLAWLFFIVMFVFTYVQFRASSKWVYYAGEARS